MKCSKKEYFANGGYKFIDCECCVPDNLFNENKKLKEEFAISKEKVNILQFENCVKTNQVDRYARQNEQLKNHHGYYIENIQLNKELEKAKSDLKIQEKGSVNWNESISQAYEKIITKLKDEIVSLEMNSGFHKGFSFYKQEEVHKLNEELEKAKNELKEARGYTIDMRSSKEKAKCDKCYLRHKAEKRKLKDALNAACQWLGFIIFRDCKNCFLSKRNICKEKFTNIADCCQKYKEYFMDPEAKK